MRSHPLRTILYALIAVALIAATGFFREFMFVNINEQLSFLYYGSDVSYMSPRLAFLSTWSYDNLYYLKWILTLVFSAVFLLESALLAKVLFASYHLKELLFIYVLLLSISVVLYLPFFLAGNGEQGYILARFFMGIAQSPLPAMLLIPALFLRKRMRSTQ